MPSRQHVFRELPVIDTIQVVDLSDVVADRSDGYMAAAGGDFVLLDGETAQSIAALWRDLAPADQYRCHVPPFGVRFMHGGRCVLEGSICWECNNVFGSDEQGPIHGKFDATNESARQLFLQLAMATTPWGRFIRPDGTSHPLIAISDVADWTLFNSIAVLLQRGLGGDWSKRLDGPGERYWDLDSVGGRITLHLQQDLGISVYPAHGASATVASLALLRAAHRVIGSTSAG